MDCAVFIFLITEIYCNLVGVQYCVNFSSRIFKLACVALSKNQIVLCNMCMGCVGLPW